MQVEFNQEFKKSNDTFHNGNSVISITPPINSSYFIYRVHLHEDQYLLAFPKFTTIGIGFAKEEDWNTNLPFSCDAEEIYNHIEHNKLYDCITKEQVIEAINLLKPLCLALTKRN